MSNSDQILKRRITKETIEQRNALNIGEMVERKIEADIFPIVPNTHFSIVSIECSESYVVGHYYACISLAQSIAEGLIKFISEKKGWRPTGDFETNIKKCLKKKLINESQAHLLEDIWTGRNDYHHLNKNIPNDIATLKEIAKQKIKLLSEIEKDLFGYTIIRGALRPNNPAFWDKNPNGTTQVFLRID